MASPFYAIADNPAKLRAVAAGPPSKFAQTFGKVLIYARSKRSLDFLLMFLQL